MYKQFKEAPITFGVIGICILMHIYVITLSGMQTSVNTAINVGALHPALVMNFHQYYRLFTANIIHFDLLHIVGNCYSLYVLGVSLGLERMLKTSRYLFLIVISMLFTTGIPCILYVMFNTGANSVMAGLSGVVFGLIGGIFLLGVRFKGIYWQIFRQIKTSVILMIFLSVTVPSISLVGHVSGGIGGIVGMLLLIYFAPIRSWKYVLHKKDDETILH